MDLKKLENQINKDIESGNIPLAIISTYGTTGTVAFDSINEIALLLRNIKFQWLRMLVNLS